MITKLNIKKPTNKIEKSISSSLKNKLINNNEYGLYDPKYEKSNCGVGFLTRKDSLQTHELMAKAHEALCAVPHRGGMSSEGVGDGAGISIDLSVEFFSKITSKKLETGSFGVGNFFLPNDANYHRKAELLIEKILKKNGLHLLISRNIPVDSAILGKVAEQSQLLIKQWVFDISDKLENKNIEQIIYRALLEIEARAFTEKKFTGLYPLSLSSKIQVLKGRLNSNELIPYFKDLMDADHKIHSFYFHTRFSTNTDPHPSMAQPFRMMAHNGELNTDKKNRLSENAVSRAKNKNIIRPYGQSDSCRFDQTLQNRIIEDKLDIVTAVVSMMPPAWENDKNLPKKIKEMFEYFSLYEEKNDGPAALIFGDGDIIGARLDRLGLRPLRTIETKKYIGAMSEAGQIKFPEDEVIGRGRIEAGGILYYDHNKKKAYKTEDTYELLAKQNDYSRLLQENSIKINDLKSNEVIQDKKLFQYKGDLNFSSRYVAYFHNQESFKFLIDPMLENGAEKISAMGYGNAINALSDNEGGVAKYFSQRFAQVTNPPLDSIRESDGMTLRVALGTKAGIKKNSYPQIIVDSPVLSQLEMAKIANQDTTPIVFFDILYTPDYKNKKKNENNIVQQIKILSKNIENFAAKKGGIIILSDRNISTKKAAMPMIMVMSAINQSLIESGLRLNVSIIMESGQISSSHHIACALGFGASAVYPICAEMRGQEKFSNEPLEAFKKFIKAAEKSLMKIMGKVGLCTVESYSGGEFFEPNYLNTSDSTIKKYFPNMISPVGGVGFSVIAKSTADWHMRSKIIKQENDIPMLGLFKERAEGAGHSFGISAVRGFVEMTEERIKFQLKENDYEEQSDNMRLLTLNKMSESFGINDKGYENTSFEKLSNNKINNFIITPGYRAFADLIKREREIRPAALRDVLNLPLNIEHCLKDNNVFFEKFVSLSIEGNNSICIKGLVVSVLSANNFKLCFKNKKINTKANLKVLKVFLNRVFSSAISKSFIKEDNLHIKALSKANTFLSKLELAPKTISIKSVQPASEITKCFASGAMSHGALVANAHEAVAHGTNMVGAMSNSGEGGEHMSRYGTIRASRIKQFASGRFGVWAGYLADPMLQEIEIKIGQGAKPGEGGQLPAPKVNVEIAAARNGVPGVELVSPPPHHDTYSIEDLAQLIHDAKAARVRVVVKLVSSYGIGTIGVGVAKAGADVINIAGGTGGTGAAAVTSLKYAGRSAEIGIAEVHQALCANNIRQKVILRCSGAHQTGTDVVKSALLGGDSFEFGTTAMMMLKCVMAKNCNIKCPAGLTTNPEMFDGDPRALAQYFLNIAHETREILASIGLTSLREARGRSDLLNLIQHKTSVGDIDLRAMLKSVKEVEINNPIYMEKQFKNDDELFPLIKNTLIKNKKSFTKPGSNLVLNNRDKTFGGQIAIDLERMLNYDSSKIKSPFIYNLKSKRRFLDKESVVISTKSSAGQSYGAFCNDGMQLIHSGTCNDGVGKSMCGGEIIVKSPSDELKSANQNVLIGNFALFGATGGRLFVEGQAGDRFAVRNSGASAVVEGVGDYCAEYMTNGSILNIGTFASGVGNGMSGGFVYQYDPENKLQDSISHDSVLLGFIKDDDELSKIHSEAIYAMLNWHFQATQSKKANFLINNWAKEKNNFSYVIPKALMQYQDYEAIFQAKTRKDLIEELAIGTASFQIEKFKKLWKSGKSIQLGKIPTDTNNHQGMYELLNSWTVLNAAQKLALKKPNSPKSINDPTITKIAKNLILTEDFKLMSYLLKHSREAITKYNDKELAVMVANKRLNDFKKSLSLRNVLSMDSLGTYGWIIYQQRRNYLELEEIPSYEELFHKESILETLV